MIDIKSKYSLELTLIKNDLDNIRSGNIYEIQKRQGVPKCSTLANRLEKHISDLLYKIENDKPGDIEVAAEHIKNM